MAPRDPDPDLNEILAFTWAVRGGSLTAASARLGVPRSTVSRRLAELEARLGARLLQRTTRALSLTDVGRVFYEHCARIVAELDEARQAVSQLQATPRGLLRLTAPMTFSPLGPILAEFLGRYPEVQLDLVCTDRKVDLVEERFDLALRAGRSADTSLVARPLGVVRRHLLAAPGFLRRAGRLRQPADLGRTDCLVFAPTGGTWTLTAGGRSVDVAVRPRLLVNDYDMLRSVARAGFGVALLPEFQCHEDVGDGRLRRVLSAWAAPDVPVFALYPSARHLSPKVIVLLDLLRQRLAPAAKP